MRRLAALTVLLAVATACGSTDPAPKPPMQEMKTEEPTPEPAAEAPAAEEPAAAAAEEPAAAEGAPDLAAMSPEEQKTFLMDLGKKVYETGGSGGVACITCHQANGEGIPGAFPPLKGSGENMGDCTTHAAFVVNGQKGEIVVQGVTYNGVMPAQANLSDLEIAAAITYERLSWGNDYGLCLPETVAAAR